MAKVNVYYKIWGTLSALLFACCFANAQYSLQYQGVDRSDSFIKDTLKLQKGFNNREACVNYVNKLPALLKTKGYPNASIDSISYDSTKAFCQLYVGETMKNTYLKTDSIDPALLEAVGWRKKKSFDFSQFKQIQEKIIAQLENSGYPFASVFMDSVEFKNDTMQAVLKVDRGPLYKIDSIRNFGSGSISSDFLQQYLGIKNGSIYRKDRLQDISSKIRELPYLQEKQPWDLTLLGTGSILNMYLDTKKSSEVNVIVGLLPANEQLADNKMLVTGEANINLKNTLGGGETIGLNWQQIQPKSPRLNVLFQQPYLFSSPFGLNFNFDLLKKDSSYVNINILLGAAYALSARQSGSVFVQRLTTNLLTVDTFAVKSTKKLPQEADVSSTNFGVTYELLTTDYRFNPRKGNEFLLGASAGTKSIRKNDVIIKLHDESDPSFDFNSLYDTIVLKSYQFRLKLKAAHYFPVTRTSTIKAALNGGWFQSPNTFRNELFQIGGYKLLRGFDEESIFASAYGVVTAEYRYLIGQNSFLAAFMDYGAAQNKSQGVNTNNNFLGVGLGLALETRAGIFNISYAVGKRDDDKFNFRQSKIHLGYVNYF
ncbi:MAG: BamA/TamA family outer membrane protein [Chitinophagaceae bacterium]|nr:BamA/TamA family outer membrane protein [Chitinophagaceae bacterium]